MMAIVYIASEWLIRVLMVPVVLKRKKASAALAWLAVIFFLPWAGFVIYLLIGEHRLGTRRLKQHAATIAALQRLTQRASDQSEQSPPRIKSGRRDMVRLAQALSDMPVAGGNAMELIDDSKIFITRLIADIDAAKRSAHLLFYIYEDDPSGVEVADALIRARQRGVECRLLADDVGSPALFKKGLARRLRAAGVEVLPALPVNPFRALFHRIDLRNHRKLAIIDGETAYTGSQNVVEPDYGGRKAGPWRDLSVRLCGPIVFQCEIVFLEDWCFASGSLRPADAILLDPKPAGGTAIQAVPSGPTFKSDVFLDFMVGIIHEAEERILITSPYFVPDPAVSLALRIAVLRGVRVDIVMPEVSDHPLLCAAARSHIKSLLDDGVHIHFHRTGLLHAKSVSVDDDLAVIGSGNFDMRSFYLNFELNLLVYGPKAASELVRVQERYIAESVEIEKDQWSKRSTIRRFVDDLAGLLGPLL